jgi:hypothetical protein
MKGRPIQRSTTKGSGHASGRPVASAIGAIALRCVLLGVSLLGPIPAGAAFVYENAHELTAGGDFDGDGRPDAVVVDRATGNYRIAYQQSPGAYLWVPVRASGVESVTGLAVGRLLSDTRDGLAFTSPQANRINFFSADNPAGAGLPLAMFIPGVGPETMAALDAGGAGNTARDDLVAASLWNGASPFQADLMRNAAGNGLTTLASVSLTSPPARANPVLLKSGLPAMVGLVVRDEPANSFRVYDVSGGLLQEKAATLATLPTDADYVYARFNPASALSQFVFYRPGSNGLYLRAVQEPVAGTFQITAGPTFDIGVAPRQVFVTEAGGVSRLLIVFGNGESARLYDFDGASFPMPGQQFSPPAGQNFTTAAVLPDGNFLMLSGAPGDGLSTAFQSYSFNGSTYVAGQSGSLPPMGPASHLANVLNFDLEPFIAANAQLLGSLNAGDWSSQYHTVNGQVEVTAETFNGTQTGLVNPAPVNLGSPPAGTGYGLVNQFSNEISFFSLTRPLGDSVAEVDIDPAPGQYGTSIRVTLTPRSSGTTVYYRIHNSDNWQVYGGGFWVFQDATVSYYGQPSGPTTAKSVVHDAHYSFTQDPVHLDSDGDGVPDYVEIAKGLDPVNSGNDADGDGFYDLDELVNSFDPNDSNSHPPSNHPRLELNAAVDLIQTLRPWDGTINLPTVSSNGTPVQCFDLQGGLLSANTVITDPAQTGVATPAVILSNIVVDTGMRLLVADSATHFDVVTPSPDKRIGRELLRVFDTTGFSHPVTLPATWMGDNIQSEANTWIAAAANVLLNTPRQTVAGDMTIYDTLTALLVERKIEEILLDRGFMQYSNLTLFPFRPLDVERQSASAAELLALESKLDDQHPAYSMSQIERTVETMVDLPDPTGYPQLRLVTSEIYRLSSASNNVPPGAVSWPLFPSPVNTLRDFLATGQLQSNYLAYVSLSTSDLGTAFNQARSILDSLQPRPFTNVTLVVRSDTFGGPCRTLDSVDGLTSWSLLQPDGSPYRILEAFILLPGSKVFAMGYTDATGALCPAAGLEVIALSLEFVPAVTPVDTDGDLLPDALELALFGSLDQSGSGDADGDMFSNLEEVLAGTDPANGASFPGGTPSPVGPPQIQIQPLMAGGDFSLSWSYPAAYADKVVFDVLSSSALGVPFQAGAVTPVQVSPGQFLVVISKNPGPPDAPSQQFFQLQMKLK